MPRLNNSKVWRAGLTARHWHYGTNIVRVSSDQNGMMIDFSIASKGGGTTQTKTNIAVADFEIVARQMIASNKAEALKIMSAIIAEHHS